MGMYKYGVLNSEGQLLLVGDGLDETVREASKMSADVFVGTETEAEGSVDLLVENPRKVPVEVAYEATGLPERIRKMYRRRYEKLYGKGSDLDYLTADLVFSFSLEEAYSKIRPFLPRVKKWQGIEIRPGTFEYRGVGELAAFKGGGLGFLADNAKLEAGQVLGNVAAVCKGLSLAPHTFGLRPLGEWVSKAGGGHYTSEEDPLVFTSEGVEAARDLYSAKSMQALASDQNGKNAAWLSKVIPGPDFDEQTNLTLCRFATGGAHGCRLACLAFSGQNSAAREPTVSKLALTRAFLTYPAEFVRVLTYSLQKYFKKGGRDKENVYFARLNVYSDVPWERLFPELFDPTLNIHLKNPLKMRESFAPGEWKKVKTVGQGTFYDYTKVPRRHEDFYIPWLQAQHGVSYKKAKLWAEQQYWLTFSFSGNTSNLKEAQRVAEGGGTVAAVFIKLEEGSPAKRELRHTLSQGGKTYAALRLKDVEAYKALRQMLRDSRDSLRQKDADLRLKVVEERGEEYKEGKFYGAKLPPASAFPMKVKVLPAPFYRFTFQFPQSRRNRAPQGQEYMVINGDANDVRGFDRNILKEHPQANIVGLDFKIPRISLGVQKVGILKDGNTVMNKGDVKVTIFDQNVPVEDRPSHAISSQQAAKQYGIDKDEVDTASAVEVAEAIRQQLSFEAPEGYEAKVSGRTTPLYEYAADSVFVTPVVEVGDRLYLKAVVPAATSPDSGPDGASE